jgi:hypothetical protein
MPKCALRIRAQATVFSKLFPTSLGTIRNIAVHPGVGSGAIYTETDRAFVTLSSVDISTGSIVVGRELSYWALFDVCEVIDTERNTKFWVNVLRHVDKSDAELKAVNLAQPEQCEIAKSQLRVCRAVLRASVAMALLGPLYWFACGAAAADVTTIFVAHGVVAVLAWFMFKKWREVCAQLFCEPMRGVELKK